MSRLYLSNPCAFYRYFKHTVLRAQSAPGFPCALCGSEGNEMAKPGRNAPRQGERTPEQDVSAAMVALKPNKGKLCSISRLNPIAQAKVLTCALP